MKRLLNWWTLAFGVVAALAAFGKNLTTIEASWQKLNPWKPTVVSIVPTALSIRDVVARRPFYGVDVPFFVMEFVADKSGDAILDCAPDLLIDGIQSHATTTNAQKADVVDIENKTMRFESGHSLKIYESDFHIFFSKKDRVGKFRLNCGDIITGWVDVNIVGNDTNAYLNKEAK